MSTKTKDQAAQQRIVIAVVAVIAVVLLMVTLAFTSFNGGGLSTRIVRPTPTTCADGTLIERCSRTQPNKCVLVKNKAVYQPRCSECGCPAGKQCNLSTGKCGSITPPDPPSGTPCSDGTLLNQCSTNKPMRCEVVNHQAVLKPSCSSCKCPSGKSCLANDTCGTPPPPTLPTKCGDGTPVGSCKPGTPMECMILGNSATYTSNCKRCGCPSGSICNTATSKCL